MKRIPMTMVDGLTSTLAGMGGAVSDIANDSLADMPTARLKGRVTAGDGSPAQKILRARFRWESGNIDAGTITLLRRAALF